MQDKIVRLIVSVTVTIYSPGHPGQTVSFPSLTTVCGALRAHSLDTVRKSILQLRVQPQRLQTY